MTIDLKSRFQAFVEQQRKVVEPATNATREFLVKHHEVISFAAPLAKSISAALITKSPFALIDGVFGGMESVADNLAHEPYYYLTDAHGWRKVKLNRQIGDVLKVALDDFPQFKMNFKYSNGYKWFRTPIGEFAVRPASQWESAAFHYRGELPDQKVIDWLSEETIKKYSGNVFYLLLKWKADETRLTSYPINRQNSVSLDKYSTYIKQCLDKGINRSFILYGSPGTGKSSLAHSIVDVLGLRTLIYKNDGVDDDKETLFFFIKQFKIDAVLLDDLDQVKEPTSMLELLERLNRDVKLVIGLVNDMKDFHPALIRPARFSEFIAIERMDEKVVESVLGDLAGEWFDKVKHFPIAFINEFVIRSKTYPIDELQKHYDELNKRVKIQLKDDGVKKAAKKKAKKKVSSKQ